MFAIQPSAFEQIRIRSAIFTSRMVGTHWETGNNRTLLDWNHEAISIFAEHVNVKLATLTKAEITATVPNWFNQHILEYTKKTNATKLTTGIVKSSKGSWLARIIWKGFHRIARLIGRAHESHLYRMPHWKQRFHARCDESIQSYPQGKQLWF